MGNEIFGNDLESGLKRAPQRNREVGRITPTRMRIVQESIAACIAELPGSMAPIVRHLQCAWLGLDNIRESEREKEGPWQNQLLL